jgi:hypothetical protein
MTHLRRLMAVVSVLLGTLLLAPGPAHADHCNPRPAPKPINEDRWWCHTPPPSTAPPETPEPTVTAAPEPTSAPGATRRPPVNRVRTPAPAIDSIEVPTEAPLATPEIIVEGPIQEEQPLDVAAPSASASSWIFGFIVGMIVGGFIGRASWGLRRKRRQQIFG